MTAVATVLSDLDVTSAWQEDVYRDLHAHPELSFQETRTCAEIRSRLQSIVAREIPPGAFGVVTVGSVQAGTTANVIPDTATLLVNVRSYDERVRSVLLAAIERITTAECRAGGCPGKPTFEYYESFPLTANDPAVTEKVTAAFVEHFGADRVHPLTPVPASEDFSVIPAAFGVPYLYWGFGGFSPGTPVYPNHNPKFAPAIQPTLRTGTEAAVVAALAYLAST